VPEASKPAVIRSRPPADQTDRQVTSPFEEEIALGWYVQALSRRWILLLLFALLGGAAGYLVASLRPALFEAVTTLLIVPPPSAAPAQMNPATFLAILDNPSLVSKVIAETELSQTPNASVETVPRIEQPAGTNVLTIGVRSTDPKTAADVSRRLANAAIALAKKLNQEEGSSLQRQLKDQLQDAALGLATAEKELLSYQQSAQIELVKEDTDAMLAERGDLLKLTIAIESERARLAAAEREIARHKPLLSATRNPRAEEALQYAEGAGREPARDAGSVDARSLDFTNPYVNPVYQTLDFQIANSRTRLAQLEQQRRQILDVTRSGGKASAQLGELYRRKMEQARLEASLEFARKVYGDVRVRYEESRTQPFASSPQLQLVAEAIVPQQPLPRKRLQSGAIGLATGLLAAGLLALMLEGRDRLRSGQIS
jgi:uncharacterized protein involved in exopolysaccharide biosynthesis